MSNNTMGDTPYIGPNKEPIESLSTKEHIITRSLRVVYALSSYLFAMLALTYFVLFISDLFIPTTVNSGPFDTSMLIAFAGNTGLLLLFGLQHSVMARPKFKQWLKNYMDPSIERATYCLGTGLVLGIICYFWIPMQGTIWSVDSSLGVIITRAIAALGWTILLIATFNIDHFELFGLRQVYCNFVGKPMPTMLFKMAGLYKWVRHPIQTGILIGMWAVPQASVSHLMLAGGMTIYVFVGLYFEEKDLIKEFGQTYRNYKLTVGKVFPFK